MSVKRSYAELVQAAQEGDMDSELVKKVRTRVASACFALTSDFAHVPLTNLEFVRDVVEARFGETVKDLEYRITLRRDYRDAVTKIPIQAIEMGSENHKFTLRAILADSFLVLYLRKGKLRTRTVKPTSKKSKRVG